MQAPVFRRCPATSRRGHPAGWRAEPGGWSLPGGLGGAAAVTAAADSTTTPEVLARLEKDRIAAWSLPADFLSPDAVIDAVRELLGPIDLDPCSHESAQCVVGARAWYEFGEDPSRDHWRGAVYLFPPMPQVSRLVDKLAAELEAGRVERAALFSTFDLRDRWVGTLLGPPLPVGAGGVGAAAEDPSAGARRGRPRCRWRSTSSGSRGTAARWPRCSTTGATSSRFDAATNRLPPCLSASGPSS